MGMFDFLFGKKETPPKPKRNYEAETMSAFQPSDRFAGFDRDLPPALEPTAEQISAAKAREDRKAAEQEEAENMLQSLTKAE